MDWASLATIGCTAAGGAGSVVWYLFNNLSTSSKEDSRKNSAEIAELQKELAAHKLYVAEHYVTSNELSKAIETLSKAIDAVFLKLDRIDGKLDGKADKA